jgi:hypothetical protein
VEEEKPQRGVGRIVDDLLGVAEEAESPVPRSLSCRPAEKDGSCGMSSFRPRAADARRRDAHVSVEERETALRDLLRARR